ncbi:hypothetical protein OIU78_022586 [Salix suchowensis]|nr:hypothetical protein OIU78_022586 [Salix suchowensis]
MLASIPLFEHVAGSFKNKNHSIFDPLKRIGLGLEMHEKKRYSELADSRLEGRVTNEEVGKLVKVALCCLHEDPSLRPTMVTVVSMLEGISPVTEPRQESLNFLRFYGRRFSEASRIEGSNERNESCMSAQQLSGPR